MINYIQSKGIEVKREGQEYRANCPFCQETKGHLYINPEKGVFYCHKCSNAGNIWKLKKHFGDIVEPIRIYKEKFKTPQPKLDEIYKNNLKNSKAPQDYLERERGFNKEAIEYFKLGFKDDYIAFPYYKNGLLVNFKYRNIHKKDFRREQGCESTIYNMDNIDKSQDVIVTEGEADCIAAWQMGFKNTVSVSIGAGAINDSWMNFFENCAGNIYIAYDNDEKGELGAKKLAERIGIARCFRIKLPFKDFNECLMSGVKKEEIDLLINNVFSYKPGKIKHATQVIVELEEDIKNGNCGKGWLLSEEWKSLNTMLGGLRHSEVTILTGETASGKTTFAINIMNDLLKFDKSVIILSSEMSAAKIMSKMFSMYKEKRINDFSDDDLKECIQYYSKKNLFFIDVHGELKMEELKDCLEYAKSKYNIEFVLIDHLHFLIDRTKENQAQAIELFMIDIVKITHKLLLHIILIAHPGKLNNTSGIVDMNDLRGSSAIKQDSDNIMIVYRDRKKEEEGMHQIVVDVQKVRDPAGIGGKQRYDFNINSQTYKENNDFRTTKRKVPSVPAGGISGERQYRS